MENWPEDFTVENLNALKPTSGIYAIVGPGSWRYVGQSKNVKKRLKEHFRTLTRAKHRTAFLQHAWTKYQGRGFTFRLLEEVAPEMLTTMEQHWMDHYRATTGLYNSAPAAESTLGFKFSEESRAHLRVMREGRKPALGMVMSVEHKAAIIAANVGRVRSDEHKAAIVAAHKGKPKSAEHRAKLSAAKTGSKRSEEAKNRTRETLARRKAQGLTVGRPKGSPVSEAERRIRAQSFLGRKHSEETRLKMAMARRRYYEERRSL